MHATPEIWAQRRWVHEGPVRILTWEPLVSEEGKGNCRLSPVLGAAWTAIWRHSTENHLLVLPLVKNTCTSILKGKWTELKWPYSLHYNTLLSWFVFIFSIELFLWLYLFSLISQGKTKILNFQWQSYFVGWILSPLKFIDWHRNPQDLNYGLI